MATVEQARDVEIDRALVEIRQRLKQMDTDEERLGRERGVHPVNIKALQAQVNTATATAFLAGAAIVTVCVTIAGIVLHAFGKL